MPDISDVCIICNMMLEKPTNHINLDTMVLSSSKTTGQQTVRVRLEQVLGHPPRGSSWLCSMCHSTLVQIEEYNCLLALFRVQYQTSDQLRLEACDLKEGADIPGNNEQHISAGDALWTLLSDKDSASKKPPASVLTLSPLNQENCILEKIGKKSFPYISQILEQQESVTADSAGMVVVKQEVCNDHHQAGVANGDVPAMDITDSYGVNFSSDNGANPQVAKKEFGYTPSLLQGEMGGAISSCLPVDSGLGEDYVSNAAISHEPEAHPAEPVVVTPDSSELDTSLSAAQPLCVVQDVCSLGIKIKEDPAGGERTLGNGALQEWEKDGMCDHPSDTAAGAVVPGMLPFEGSITKTLPCKEESSESSVSHGYSDTSLQTGQLLTHLLTSQPTVLEIIPKLE